MKRSASLRRKKPMNRGTSTLKRSGFGPRALIKPSARSSASVKTLRVWKSAKPQIFRSEDYLAAVRTLDCVSCGRARRHTQAAHSNQPRFGKGMRIKASDATAMALCSFPEIGVSGCHEEHDQGGLRPKLEWWEFEYRMIAKTVLELIRRGVLVPAEGLLLTLPRIEESCEAIAVALVEHMENGRIRVAR